MKRPILVTMILLGLASSNAILADPQHVPKVDERPALPFPPGIDPQSICGTSRDFQDVELYDGTLGVPETYVATHEPSTVQLQWLGNNDISAKLPNHSPGNVAGARWCTGTLVTEDRVLTAGHCFDVQDGTSGWTSPFTFDVDGNKIYASSDILATLQVVNFRYQREGATGALREAEVYPITGLVEYRLGGLDYAIIKVGPNATGERPSSAFPAAEILTRAPVLQEPTVLLQHPQGEPKKIEAGQVVLTRDSDVYYSDLDTLGGSSGSGVRDASGAIIGVHTHGGCSASGGANRGVTTEAISRESGLF